LASATFSASGFGFSFLPVFVPAMTLASWLESITSTGTESSGGISSALVENDSITHPSTQTCRATDAITVLSTLTFTRAFPFPRQPPRATWLRNPAPAR
jgi:hypothetical protein